MPTSNDPVSLRTELNALRQKLDAIRRAGQKVVDQWRAYEEDASFGVRMEIACEQWDAILATLSEHV